MKEYKFDNCEIGISETFSVEISETMMKSFSIISGDRNPMHMDEEYAKEHGFDGKLVYGLLTASFYSQLVGMYLPGKYCILKSIEIFFDRPVYEGDILTIIGRIREKDERFQQVTVKGLIKNQHGKTISKANILVGFYE